MNTSYLLQNNNPDPLDKNKGCISNCLVFMLTVLLLLTTIAICQGQETTTNFNVSPSSKDVIYIPPSDIEDTHHHYYQDTLTSIYKRWDYSTEDYITPYEDDNPGFVLLTPNSITLEYRGEVIDKFLLYNKNNNPLPRVLDGYLLFYSVFNGGEWIISHNDNTFILINTVNQNQYTFYEEIKFTEKQ